MIEMLKNEIDRDSKIYKGKSNQSLCIKFQNNTRNIIQR